MRWKNVHLVKHRVRRQHNIQILCTDEEPRQGRRRYAPLRADPKAEPSTSRPSEREAQHLRHNLVPPAAHRSLDIATAEADIRGRMT